MAYESLRVITLQSAFEIVFEVLKSNKLSVKEESMLEALILSCPQIEDGGASYIKRDDLNNFCSNFVRSLRENDGSFLHRQKGYKGPLVDIEEFVESKEYLNAKGSLRPVVKYELQDIVEKMDGIREVVLTGCVSGDTEVTISRQRGSKFVSKKICMKDLYEKFNRIKKGWEPERWITTKTLSLVEDQIRSNDIKNVFYNGKKPLYLVTTSSGKRIKCTLEHKFKLPGNADGFKPIGEIGVGGTVICRSPMKRTGGKKKIRYANNENRNIVYSIPFHPYARRHIVAGRNYKRLCRARIRIDAALNNLSEEQFINILRKDEAAAAKLNYTDPSLVIHHINIDDSDDRLENLRLMSQEKHGKLHGVQHASHIGNCDVHEETVISIKYMGIEDVYDLEVSNYKYHSYLVDNIIVSNSTSWGKTHLARELIKYILYKLSMLYDPQYQYDLALGSSIVIVLQAVSFRLSKKVLFNPIIASLSASKYFTQNFPFNKQVTSELQFPNQIYISPISGSELAALGENVYAGIMSEVNYWDVTENSKQASIKGLEDTTFDQATVAYTNLIQRLKFRFQNYGKIPGVLVLDSATNYPGDFLSKKAEEAKWDEQIHVVRHMVWDTMSADKFSGDKFLVEVGTLDRHSRIIESREFALPEADILEVPVEYKTDFERDIESALRDCAGLATGHRRAFMPFKDAVVDAYTVYEAIYNNQKLFTEDSIDLNNHFVGPLEWDLLINKEYLEQLSFDKNANFCLHVDLGLSQDHTGLAIGHVQDYKNMPSTSFYSRDTNTFTEMINIEAPILCIDGILHIRPPTGGELNVDFLKGFMLYLTQRLNVKIVTMDSFQDVSFKQAFNNIKGVRYGTVSTVTSPLPYMELKTCYVEGRIIHQNHPMYIEELLFLEYDPKKQAIDHVAHHAKDICDAVGGVTNMLIHKMARYRRSRKPAQKPVPAHRQLVVTKL